MQNLHLARGESTIPINITSHSSNLKHNKKWHLPVFNLPWLPERKKKINYKQSNKIYINCLKVITVDSPNFQTTGEPTRVLQKIK
jgi:hypothetical protein